MELKYHSGEVIKLGDRVSWHGHLGIIELVATELTGDPEKDWYVTDVGRPGVLIREISEPKHFGLVYETETEEAEDLELLERAAL
jgi:hypothetical protein